MEIAVGQKKKRKIHSLVTLREPKKSKKSSNGSISQDQKWMNVFFGVFPGPISVAKLKN
jgi:hypothetical protein